MEQYEPFYELLVSSKQKYKKLRLIRKEESLLFNFLYWILFMKYWHPDFMDSYATTIFNTIYIPGEIIGTRVGYVVLRHELVHVADSNRYPFLYQLSYLFLLPSLFSFRAYWEYRAYCENLRVEYEMFGSVRMEAINYYSQLFCDNSYIWMLPFKSFMVDRFLFFCYKNKIEII
jgi:hypothetical protein